MKAFVIALASVLVSSPAFAHQVQIPTVQACNIGNVEGSATV